MEEVGNATAYAHRKRQDIIKNAQAIAELDMKLAKAWAKMELISETDGKTYLVRANHDELRVLQHKRASLKTAVKGSIDDALEIVIAYWIEARNAHNNIDPLRALHCLIECHFFLGITYSPKFDYEAKSEAGKKSGRKERDALARAVLDVMSTLEISKTIRDQEVLRGKIFDLIQAHPEHAGALRTYDEWALKGKSSDESTADRFSETLRKWVVGKKQPYPRVTALFEHLCRQIDANASTKKISSRKASS
ncbi:hypothetical protein [Pseudoxanthomonas putridarboris]|uniref:Uncharacterized protein n=1 Tax=Pseudoxanthomonas putridarboris TaxID=752605 RepID=A0ABU9IWP1_9GAMM